MRINKLSIITGIATLTLAVSPGFAMTSKSTNSHNKNVPLGMTSKAPYTMKRISKVRPNTSEDNKLARNKAAKPNEQKPGQFSKGYAAPSGNEAITVMNNAD